jgi:hypothetical protein
MNCGNSAGTVEYPAKPRISAPHTAAMIAAEGPVRAEAAELIPMQSPLRAGNPVLAKIAKIYRLPPP